MQLPPPTVKFTQLPSSTKGLLDCVRNEIKVIEDELEGCYKTNNDHSQESLEDAIDDGFMCVDLRVLERKLKVWHSLFSRHYTVTPCFAIKCNPDPYVVEWLARSSAKWNLSLGFDCASIAELELAKEQIETYSLTKIPKGNSKIGKLSTTRIVYANPQRAEADLMKALELFANTPDEIRQDLWMTLDGVEEVYKIARSQQLFLEKHPGLTPPNIKIILRIWVPDGHSLIPLGEKFGMRMDEIERVVEACLVEGISPEHIIGVSFHCGSGCESVETYLEALEMGRRALEAINRSLVSSLSGAAPKCWLLDIGGGFPGLDGLYGDSGRFAAQEDSTEAPQTGTTVATIAHAVRPVLESFADGTAPNMDVPLTLIAEPGRYFVEGAIALASKIYQKQVLHSNNLRVYRIPHGVQGVFKDVLLCGESFVPQPLVLSEEKTLFPSRILGPSGDDAEDLVCESCFLPDMNVGDWLVFDRMGAYTLSIASRAGRPVMRYVLGGGSKDDEAE